MVGLAVFGGLLAYCLLCARRAYACFATGGMRDSADLVAALALGLVRELIGSLFLHFTYPRYFWLLVGISFALPEVARRAAPGAASPAPAAAQG